MPKRKIVTINDNAENNKSVTAFTQRKRKEVTQNLDEQSKENIIDLCESEDSDSHSNVNNNNININTDANETRRKEHLKRKIITGDESSSTSSFSKKTKARRSESKVEEVVKSKSPKTPKYSVFCDLDGVLVDFEHGVMKLFNNRYKSVDVIPPNILWSRISSCKDFFSTLPWTKDGLELWQVLLFHFQENPSMFSRLHILTGCPRNQSSRFQKFDWCQRHLNLYDTTKNKNANSRHSFSTSSTLSSSNPISESSCEKESTPLSSFGKVKFVHVDKAAKKCMHQIVYHSANTAGMQSITSMFQRKQKSNTSNLKSSTSSSSSSSTKHTLKKKEAKQIDVITCWSRNKHYESKKNHVLIDDRISLKDAWISKGGIFIHHTSTKDTIQQMIKLGIIHDSL